jgi:hypothetical protein
LRGATLIPTAAVQHNGQAAFVYVLADNKAHLRPITVGVTEGQTAEVQGINPGDVLATSSFDKLQDNTAINLSNGGPGGGGGRPAGGGRRANGGNGNSGSNNPGNTGTSGSSAP